MDIKANNSAEMKRKNRGLIMRMIRAQQMSRADVARNAGLTRAAVTVIVESLIRDGIVAEGETVASDVGRRPTMLRIDPSARFAFGVDISSAGITVGMTDLDGKVIERHDLPNSGEADHGGKSAVDMSGEIAALIQDMAARHGVSGKRNLGVGVSSPGPVDVTAGRILDPPHLSAWRDFPVAEELGARLGVRVFIDKDANALALAEKNSRSDSDNFLFIIADNGLGGGFVKNGKLYRGAGGFGCEIGHIGIVFDGEQCRCGNHGCAELYASIPSLMRYARREGIGAANWKETVERAQSGDAGCMALAGREADMLASMCVSAVNVFEPEMIVLGGQLSIGAQWFAPLLEERVSSRMITRKHHRVAVRGSRLSFDAGLSAASGLAVEVFFLRGEIDDDNT